MRAERENEQMVLSQTLSFYRGARDELAAGRPEAARKVLADLRQFLDQPSVAALPAMSQRRPVELFLVGSLEELIKRQGQERQNAESLQSLVASADLVTAVAGLVQQGDALLKEQDYAGAREIYLSAMARIPAVRVGYARLAEIEKTFADKRKTQVAGLLAMGNAAYKRGDYAGAEAQYRRALEVLQGEQGTVDTLVAQLEEIGSLTRNRDAAARLATLEEVERKRAATLAEINALRERFGQLAGQEAASPRESLLTLLETKLLVQKVLLSREVIAQYPDLSDRLDRYLDALVAERTSEARLATIRDLDTLLGSLIEKSGKERAERALLAYNSEDQKGTLMRILDKLQVLLK
jgi:tetratricopeptide (TPR) repeat protein